MSLFRTIQDKMGLKNSGPSITEAQIKAALSKVIDPDLHRDIVSLGFVTKVEIKGSEVSVTINLTTPACPVKDQLRQQAIDHIKEIPTVTAVNVEMTAVTTGRKSPTGGVATGPIPALANVKNLVAIASGKGGVGKSTTTVNMAYALAKSGAKVGVLDCDVYGPSIPLMMNVNGGAAARDNMLEPPLADGIKVISIGMFSQGGPNKAAIMRGPMAGNLIRQFLSQVNWGELDYLLMDYPPGTGDIQLTISQTAPLTGAVVVTTPQEVSLIDVRKAISMFETLKVPVVGIVETMSYYFCKGEGEKHFIFGQGGGEKLCKEYGLPFLGGIPIEPAVVQGGDNGQAIVKLDVENAAAKAYVEVAGRAAAQVSIINSKDGDALEQFSLVWKP